MFLSELKLGQRAVIVELCDEGAGLKLIEMGCLPGEVLLVKITAPRKDPIAIEVSGNLISLRKSEARAIKVKLISA